MDIIYDSRHRQDPGKFLKKIFEDKNIQAIDKPAGVSSDDFERRVHRLDKDTSGVLLIAKNDQALEFLQKQFKERKVKKQYLALVTGNLKNNKGVIETLLGRSPKDKRKQAVYFPGGPKAKNKREASTGYKVLQKFENYDLIEAEPQTGRKHQIRVHLAYLGHPIAGDKLYSFKDQKCPGGLKRQFLHSSYLKIKLLDNQIKEFKSSLPKDLELCLQKLKPLLKHN